MVFDKLERTLDNINRQNNLRSENGNSNNDRNSNTNIIHNTNSQNNRQQENRTRRSNSITTEERETTVTEPPLPFYKQLTSMSIHEEPQNKTLVVVQYQQQYDHLTVQIQHILLKNI